MLIGSTNRPAKLTGQPAEDEALRKPISYFNANCSSCHGDYGSYWGEGFAADYDMKELSEVVDEMAAGPGFAPLEGEALAVQTAYNESVAKKLPFAVAFKDGDSWRGEATPKATLKVDGKPVQLDGHTWSAPAGGATELSVTLGDITRTVKLTGDKVVWTKADHDDTTTQPTTNPITKPASRPAD